RAVNGRIALENGQFAFSNLRGVSGRIRLTDVDGSYDYSPASPGVLQLHARGDADLGELREQAQRGLLPAEFAKLVLSVQALGGRGKFDIALTRPADSKPRAAGKVALESARLQWDQYVLTDINGDFAFTPTEIKTDKVRALISGSPVEVRLAVKNYGADDGVFDLAVDSPGVKAGIVSRLLLETGSIQDPGIVRGSVHYRGSFNDKQDRKFTGNLELLNVQLATHPLLQPLRQLNGKISIDESGIEFQDMKGLLVGFAASASGRWRYAQKPQLIFDFTAPNLDITYLISQIDPEPGDFYDNLQAEGRIALGQGRINNFEFTDSKSNLILDRRMWRFSNLTLRAGGGAGSGPLTVVHKPDTLGIIAEPRAKNVPIAVFLRWFDISNAEITGTVDLTGKFDTAGKGNAERKRNLNGAFNLKIADGTIYRMRILVQLLNVLDLSRWFTFQLPDLSKQGIRFRAITGDFKVASGVYSTDNLLVDSDDLRMTGAGKIDVPGDEIDFVVAVRPFAGIDAAITQIPLLGRGIAAIKNSFLVASFNIRGRIDDPTITPAPLGTLSEMFWGVLGIPKSLIPFGGDADAQKEVPQDQLSAPSR
ncbi:MAG TPA: AsmA-like C-terminal domain-containing protein, partial [Candidatus Binatia bacterium]